jgi:hypothetical protein
MYITCAKFGGVGVKKRLELHIVKKAIQSAFLPFRCSVENIENGNRVRFRVFDERENLLLTVEAWTRRICDVKRGFPTIIGTARARLEGRGFYLLPWDSHLPSGLGDEDTSTIENARFT